MTAILRQSLAAPILGGKVRDDRLELRELQLLAELRRGVVGCSSEGLSWILGKTECGGSPLFIGGSGWSGKERGGRSGEVPWPAPAKEGGGRKGRI